jgi:cell division protein FtsL
MEVTMIRILNFLCVALAGFSCLALYHVSERTRIARVELSHVNHQIAQERGLNSVLEAEWAKVADPSRIQQLATTQLGLQDSTSAQLASLEMLPRRGEDQAPLSTSPVRKANVVVPVVAAAKPDPRIRLASARTGM